MSTKETLLNVSGMSCSSCVRHVELALREIEGVRGVEVQLREGKVLVKHDAGAAPESELVEALRDAGYESTPGVAAFP
jgi:copper chaperone